MIISYIAAAAGFLAGHTEEAEQYAIDLASNQISLIVIKLSRVRTVSEQVEIVKLQYANTLFALEELDKQGFTNLFHSCRMLLEQGPEPTQLVSDNVERLYYALGSITIPADAKDFESMKGIALSDIPKDNPVYPFLEAYINSFYNIHLLRGINELFDALDANPNGEKLTDEQLADNNVKGATINQKAMIFDYFRKELGIEVVDGLAQKRYRAIGSLINVSPDEVRKGTPSKTDRPYNQAHTNNLEFSIKWFKDFGSNRVAAEVEEDLTWEKDKYLP